MPGIELARRLHRDVVGPLLVAELGEDGYAAAILGPGSEVLGFDTVRSTDHDWGPRLQVFLPLTVIGRADELAERIRARLPPTVAGHATAIAWSDGHQGNGVQLTGLTGWLTGRLGVDPRAGFGPEAWLATPTQALAEVTGGAVLHDPAGELAAVRRTLAWYPDDVWRCVLAGLWSRIDEEEPFVGRTGEVGDVLGCRVITARLVRDLVADLLAVAPALSAVLQMVGLGVRSAAVRDDPDARSERGDRDRGPAGPRGRCSVMPIAPSPSCRMRRVCASHGIRRFAPSSRGPSACWGPVGSPTRCSPRSRIRRLTGRRPLGAVDCYLDNTPLLADPARVRAVAAAACTPGRMG